MDFQNAAATASWSPLIRLMSLPWLTPVWADDEAVRARKLNGFTHLPIPGSWSRSVGRSSRDAERLDNGAYRLINWCLLCRQQQCRGHWQALWRTEGDNWTEKHYRRMPQTGSSLDQFSLSPHAVKVNDSRYRASGLFFCLGIQCACLAEA